MISLRTTLVFALLLFCSSVVVADPLNFMVGPLTFVRPAEWTWKDPELSTKASAELKMVDSKTSAEAQILCSFSESPAESVASRWKSYFIDPAESETTTTNLHGFVVTYVLVQGTHAAKAKSNRTIPWSVSSSKPRKAMSMDVSSVRKIWCRIKRETLRRWWRLH